MAFKLGDKVMILSDKKAEIHGHNQYVEIDGKSTAGKVVNIQDYEWGHKVKEEYWTYTIELKLPLYRGVRIRCQVPCKQNELELILPAEKSPKRKCYHPRCTNEATERAQGHPGVCSQRVDWYWGKGDYST